MRLRTDPLRRGLLVSGTLLWLRPLAAAPEPLQAAVQAFAGGTPVHRGKVRLELATLVEMPFTCSTRSRAAAAAGAVSTSPRQAARSSRQNRRADREPRACCADPLRSSWSPRADSSGEAAKRSPITFAAVAVC